MHTVARLNLELSLSLAERLVRRAQAKGLSKVAYIREALERALAVDEAANQGDGK